MNLDREKFLALTIALSSGPLGACAPASTTATTPPPSSNPSSPPPAEPAPSDPPPATTPPPAAQTETPNPCSSWAPWGECVAHGDEEPPFFECQQDDPSVEGCKAWRSNKPHNGCSVFDAKGKCTS